MARRLLSLDAPELAQKLNSPQAVSLDRDDLTKLLPLLRQRLPALSDSKSLLSFLENRGLTFKEIHAAIDILDAEGQKPKNAP